MTHRRHHERSDWVLLALDAARSRGLTALKLQKSLFLLGARRRSHVGQGYYDFRPYHYGPFCADIYHDADMLAKQGLVVLDASRGQSMRRYLLTEDGKRAAARAAKRTSGSVLRYLKDVVAWAQPLPFNVLVRAVYDAFPEMRENSVFWDSEDA